MHVLHERPALRDPTAIDFTVVFLNCIALKIIVNSSVNKIQPSTPIAASLRELLPYIKNSLLLDLGCGGGAQLMEFPNGIGFDISLQNLERLKVAGRKICCGNLNAQLPFRENAIDTILMSHVLEHVLCPFSLCMEAYRVLRPKGLVIIGVPLEHSFFRLLTMDNYFKHHSGHLYSFFPLGLQKLVETAGFLTKKLLFDIPMARRLESSKLQYLGNRILPRACLQWICANFWVVGEKPL